MVEEGWKYDYTWDPEDDELAEQWESAKVHAWNFGLWASTMTYVQFDRSYGPVLWQTFMNQFDPLPQRLLTEVMYTSVSRRIGLVRTWN